MFFMSLICSNYRVILIPCSLPNHITVLDKVLITPGLEPLSIFHHAELFRANKY